MNYLVISPLVGVYVSVAVRMVVALRKLLRAEPLQDEDKFFAYVAPVAVVLWPLWMTVIGPLMERRVGRVVVSLGAVATVIMVVTW